MNAAIVLQEARAKRKCGYCAGDIVKTHRFLRVDVSLWSKNGSSTGGVNICGRCLTELTLELNNMAPSVFSSPAPAGSSSSR
jgi:hypothetical protein